MDVKLTWIRKNWGKSCEEIVRSICRKRKSGFMLCKPIRRTDFLVFQKYNLLKFLGRYVEKNLEKLEEERKKLRRN